MKVRPRGANVMGVVWLYLGCSWFVIGGLGLYSYVSMSSAMESMGGDMGGMPAMLWWFPLGTLILGCFGLIGAVGLLKQRESGRRVLRGVNFGTIALLAAFTWQWVSLVTQGGGYSGTYVSSGQVLMAIEGIVVGVVLAVPFLVMGRRLGNRELCLWTGQT